MAKKKPAVAAPVAPAAVAAPAPVAVPTPEVPAAPAVAAPKPAKVVQNGVSRPSEGTVTGYVWKLADQISATLKAPAPRADVMKACAELKAADGVTPSPINAATAATQYGKWRKFNGLKSEPRAVVAAPAVAPAAPAVAATPTPAAPPAASVS